MRRLWTNTEINIVKSGLPIEKVAEITGRTISAVKSMKYRLSADNMEIIREIPLAFILTQKEKEARLYNLMNKLGVRLKEKA